MIKPELILEVANTHNGELNYALDLIKKFSILKYDGLGIKFQPFKYDEIALNDFSWYDVYRELFFDEKTWGKILFLAKKNSFNVWLDIFDSYGCNILKNNFESIRGIKLQASILNNLEVFNLLRKLNVSNKKLIINISGFDLHEIEKIIEIYERLNFEELILQIGFQAYPTDVKDSSLNKIDIIKSSFPKIKLCYADHLDAENDLSKTFPILAFIKGCEYIEKHVCVDRIETVHDYYSALECDEIKALIENINAVSNCLNVDFLSSSEKNYLEKTEQIPVIKESIRKGQLITEKDVVFRRTDKKGIKLKEIKIFQKTFNILNSNLNKNDTIREYDFKKAKIGVIVAGRMKSSRLKKKAILKINEIPSVELCLSNCFNISNVDNVILATSTLEEDSILKNYTLKNKAGFFQGDPDDVILRFLDAAKKHYLDVVVRVTADCPVVSSEIANILLKSHFESGADYTAPKKFAVGTNCEIYSVEMLRRIIDKLGSAKYSEYMTWYAQNNAHIFKINMVDLPQEYIRDYRLTLDYDEDLTMFRELFKNLKREKKEPNIKNIFEILDKNPKISELNKHITLVYKTDKDLIDKLNKVTRIKI